MRTEWKVIAFLAIVIGNGQHVEAQFELIGKAQPDEFYNGIGQPYVPIGAQAPDAEGQPKVNQDYLWGMAATGPMIWFGTGGNAAGMASGQVAAGLADPEPDELISKNGILCRVWEFGASQYPGLPDLLRTYIGDWRPPTIFQYNALTNELIDRTPNDPRINTTLGLRSAGTANGVVLLAGSTIYQVGINVFAFNAYTGKYLGSTTLMDYSNIRRWLNVNGQLYTSAQKTLQIGSAGSVLRWKGNLAAPFVFETVGNLDNEGAYLAYHEDRLFVGTWPSVSLITGLIKGVETVPAPCGIWMSPKLGLTGLNTLSAYGWKKVWTPASYEPDPSIVGGYAIGAMESYGGALYWGNITFPAQGYRSFYNYYGYFPSNSDFNNTERTPLVLKATGFGRKNEQPVVELLYGDAQVPVYTPNGEGSGTWAMQNNLMGSGGTYGSSGFGDYTNRYVWSSAVYNDKLYFGTFDITALSYHGRVADGTAGANVGADLWVFNTPNSGAVAVSRSGCGNQLNHGVRNMVSTWFGLYLGTANSANLLTDPDDDIPDGGWELLRLMD